MGLSPRDSPVLSQSKAPNETLLQGLKLHKIPVPGTTELSNVHKHDVNAKDKNSNESPTESATQRRQRRKSSKKRKQQSSEIPQTVYEIPESSDLSPEHQKSIAKQR